ncbi:MAG: pyridoxamine 5'-phosphate oxidase family protein [Chloroflexi bacterium]|nr:pyridoxamine 5'-phosphate oxidase family protein [Chloroflexota bacterium]
MKNVTDTKQDDIKKLGELIKDIKFAMLTTFDKDGTLRSRPMTTQEVEFDGDLWFFAGKNSELAKETKKQHQVNLAYAAPDDNRYVSVSGFAEWVQDKQKIKELWNPLYKAWFPDGLDDPNLALLKIHVEKAEYWEAPGGAVVTLIGFVKALATGKQADVGTNEKIELDKVVKH